MAKLKWVVFGLLLVVFLSSCPLDDPIDTGHVATPTIHMNPNKTFNNGPISITIDTATPDADIYYTTDGSIPSPTNGTLYIEEFDLTSQNDTPYRGYVSLRAIGIKENYTDSVITRQVFQIFSQGAYGDYSGPSIGEGAGYGGAPGSVKVELAFSGGSITSVSFTNVNSSQSSAEWNMATEHAGEFIKTMNHWDFIPVSGATFSSQGIREAAREAIENIP